MNRIAELRKKSGISQKELAQIFGLAQNTLSQYENEARNPPAKFIAELASYFDVPENYILGIKPNDEKPTDLNALDCRNVTKITETSDKNMVNILISIGWRLLHIGEDRTVQDDGSGYSYTNYVLGWYGDPREAHIPQFGKDPRDRLWVVDPEFDDYE